MDIVFFSDTHGQHHNLHLPEAEIAICCGDITSRGYKSEVADFLGWYCEQPHPHKILIAGNHDFYFQPDHPRNFTLNPGENPRDIIPKNITYLEDETVTINGLKIFGSPWTPWFHDWAFNALRGTEIQLHWNKIQVGTDIVLTHGPPARTVLDACITGEKVGCENLFQTLERIQPKICAFGHIHEARGKDEKTFRYPLRSHESMSLINCSVLNERYQLVAEPYLVNLSTEKD